jgi:hypothetical protein
MPAGALSLHLVPASGAVLPGATVPVSLLLSDLGDGDALGSFDIEIAIEGGALSLATVRLGEFGSSDAQLFDLDARVDGFRLRWVSLASPEHLDAQQPAGFEIAGFEVEAQHAGVARLVFASVSLGDAVGSGLAIDSADAARIAVIRGDVALLAGGLASSLQRAGRRCLVARVTLRRLLTAWLPFASGACGPRAARAVGDWIGNSISRSYTSGFALPRVCRAGVLVVWACLSSAPRAFWRVSAARPGPTTAQNLLRVPAPGLRARWRRSEHAQAASTCSRSNAPPMVRSRFAARFEQRPAAPPAAAQRIYSTRRSALLRPDRDGDAVLDSLTRVGHRPAQLDADHDGIGERATRRSNTEITVGRRTKSRADPTLRLTETKGSSCLATQLASITWSGRYQLLDGFTLEGQFSSPDTTTARAYYGPAAHPQLTLRRHPFLPATVAGQFRHLERARRDSTLQRFALVRVPLRTRRG